MKRKLWISAVLAALSVLGACGGGSDGGTATATSGTASGSMSSSADSTAPALPGARVEPGVVASDTPTDEFIRLADAAEAKRKEVEDQVVDGPCESDDQCGLLSFNEYSGPCAFPSQVPYLLGSATAEAAMRATDEFNALSIQAAAAQPSFGMVMCTMMIQPVRPSCDAQKKKCVVGDASQVFAPEPVVLVPAPAN